MKEAGSENESTGRTRAEHVTLAISLALIAAVLGGLALVEFGKGSARPRIAVEPQVAAAYEYDGQWYVPVSIRNEGDEATAGVLVEFELEVAGTGPETAELEVAWVAAGEEASGYAVFDEQPRESALESSVVSVTKP